MLPAEPLTSTRDGIPVATRFAQRNAPLRRRAAPPALRIGTLDYAGMLTIEFFVRGAAGRQRDALRGAQFRHWTIEGAVTSQFEKPPAGDPRLPLLGNGAPVTTGDGQLYRHDARPRPVAQPAGVHLHDYAKAPRAGRKARHCTIVAAVPPTGAGA